MAGQLVLVTLLPWLASFMLPGHWESKSDLLRCLIIISRQIPTVFIDILLDLKLYSFPIREWDRKHINFRITLGVHSSEKRRVRCGCESPLACTCLKTWLHATCDTLLGVSALWDVVPSWSKATTGGWSLRFVAWPSVYCLYFLIPSGWRYDQAPTGTPSPSQLTESR